MGFQLCPHYRTKQYKQFKRLALAGIYETATDRKVNDNDRLGSTSELLARHRQHIGRLSQWSAPSGRELYVYNIYACAYRDLGLCQQLSCHSKG